MTVLSVLFIQCIHDGSDLCTFLFILDYYFAFCKQIKQELGIKDLSEQDAKRIMALYLNKTAVETATEKMKEKQK